MPTQRTIVGVDLGGTKTAVALLDADSMEILSYSLTDTHAKLTFDHVLTDLLVRIDSIRRDDTVAIGIGVPGPIDVKTGRIVRMPNIPGAEGHDIKRYVAMQTGIPVFLDNDANCFALAEAQLGAGKDHSVVIGITMGTGVGGGVVMNGRLYHGAHGFAGEIGHALLVPGKPPFDTPDKRGEVEQFLSGSAMRKRCAAARSPKDYLEGEVCSFMHPEVFREIAWMVTSLVHILDPSVVVFGGSAGRALQPHLETIEAELKSWMLPGIEPPQLAVGTVQHASVIGAGLLTKPA